MAGDMGTKALGLPKFPRFWDTVNGYALVKAAYPDLNLPDYVYEISDDDEIIPKRRSKLQRVQALIMKFEVVSIDEDFSAMEDSIGSDSEYHMTQMTAMTTPPCGIDPFDPHLHHGYDCRALNNNTNSETPHTIPPTSLDMCIEKYQSGAKRHSW